FEGPFDAVVDAQPVGNARRGDLRVQCRVEDLLAVRVAPVDRRLRNARQRRDRLDGDAVGPVKAQDLERGLHDACVGPGTLLDWTPRRQGHGLRLDLAHHVYILLARAY